MSANSLRKFKFLCILYKKKYNRKSTKKDDGRVHLGIIIIIYLFIICLFFGA